MKRIILFTALLVCSLGAKAQLFVDDSYTIDDMINGFFSTSGVSISNVSYSGAPLSLAFFEGSQSNIGLNAGLLITTGKASNAVGPNNIPGLGANMALPGTPWLDALIPGYITFDASVIEMDIVPTSDTLAFRYVFGSEEYLEYVNSNFNDLFAFLISGPGIQADSIYVPPTIHVVPDSTCGVICIDTLIFIQDTICYYDSIQMQVICQLYTDTLTQYCYQNPECPMDTIIYPGYWYYSPGGTNIAQIPNTNLPVAINNLNHLVQSQYLVDNPGGATVQYDAFTHALWAKTAVVPGETYHVRIAVADAGDHIFDSGVFLGIESMGGDSLLPVEPAFLMAPQPGTRKVDFDNNTFWATEWHWDFGDGFTSDERFPEHTYTADGTYTVALTARNWCSEETTTQNVSFGVTGTNDLAAADLFKLSPNPTKGSFVIDLMQDDAAQIRIWSLDGKLMLDRPVQDGERIQIGQYGKGQYLVQITANQHVFTERIVVND